MVDLEKSSISGLMINNFVSNSKMSKLLRWSRQNICTTKTCLYTDIFYEISLKSLKIWPFSVFALPQDKNRFDMIYIFIYFFCFNLCLTSSLNYFLLPFSVPHPSNFVFCFIFYPIFFFFISFILAISSSIKRIASLFLSFIFTLFYTFLFFRSFFLFFFSPIFFYLSSSIPPHCYSPASSSVFPSSFSFFSPFSILCSTLPLLFVFLFLYPRPPSWYLFYFFIIKLLYLYSLCFFDKAIWIYFLFNIHFALSNFFSFSS